MNPTTEPTPIKFSCQTNHAVSPFNLMNKRIRPIQPSVDGVFYWYVNRFSDEVSKEKLLLTIQKSLKEVEQYITPLKFEMTKNKSKAHVILHFASEKDPELARAGLRFDGRGGTIAWGVAANSGHSHAGWMFFDPAEPFSLMNKRGHIYLKAVFLHELGHVFNIAHQTAIEKQLMNPYYQPLINNLQDDDIKAWRFVTKKYRRLHLASLRKKDKPSWCQRVFKGA